MEKTMQAAIMEDLRQISFISTPIPQIKADEVLVQIEYVGICGSDLHYYEAGRIGDFVVTPPFILGHETAGTIIQTGTAVTHLAVGDRVALEPGKTCGLCEFCQTGRYNLCPEVIFFATPPVPGVFQEYVAHQANLCFKLPPKVSTLEGALIEPLAIGFHAARQGGATLGQKAVVMGAGAIGLVTLMALKAMGLSDITVVDILDNRLDKALSLGASQVINATKQDPLATVLANTQQQGVDLVIETAGTQITTCQGIAMAKKGATMVLVGYSASGEMTLPVSEILNRELTLKSVFRYRHIYPLAIEAVASGQVQLKDLVTDVFDFQDLPQAMESSVLHKDTIVKAVVKMK